MHDANIPDDQKQSAYTRECDKRYLQLKDIVFAKRAELNEIEQEMRAWQVNAQAAAGKLHSSEREKYRHLDVNYTPTSPVKKIKKSSDKPKSNSAYNKTEVAAICEKYGVPALGVRMMMISRNLSAEAAAKELASTMKKPVAQ
jgi:hypothetical protein